MSFPGVCFSVKKRFLFFLRTNSTHFIHSRTISFSTRACSIVAEKKNYLCLKNGERFQISGSLQLSLQDY